MGSFLFLISRHLNTEQEGIKARKRVFQKAKGRLRGWGGMENVLYDEWHHRFCCGCHGAQLLSWLICKVELTNKDVFNAPSLLLSAALDQRSRRRPLPSSPSACRSWSYQSSAAAFQTRAICISVGPGWAERFWSLMKVKRLQETSSGSKSRFGISERWKKRIPAPARDWIQHKTFMKGCTIIIFIFLLVKQVKHLCLLLWVF